MARPAVIIGLGGTGQEVLTYVKKDLLETNEGKMPDNVRLLAFDTMPTTQTHVTAAGQVAEGQGGKNQMAIGQVKLDKNREFFGLSGDGRQLGEQVVQGKAPNIGSWFDAKFYREKLAPSLWDLSAGSGAIRQFGRLAFFMHFGDTLLTEISRAYTEVRAQAKEGNELEVLIIASFAGGTGAGMFIDTGIICRMLANIVNNNLKIRGLFVLPRVFALRGNLGSMELYKRARAFAAWRELERVMNAGSEYGAPRVQYQVNGQLYQLGARPFDQCYLVDSKRELNSLERLTPEEGVFPGVADFISFLIDRQAGQQYTLDSTNRDSYSFTNVMGVGYAALGTWSIKAPVHYALEEYSLSFAKEFMDVWLAPQRDMNQTLIGLEANKNAEDNFRAGDEAAPSFLADPNGVPIRVEGAGSPISRPDNIVHNTLFLQQIGAISRLMSSDLARRKVTDAQGGYTRLTEGVVDPSSYLNIFTALPVDNRQTMLYYGQKNQPIEEEGIQREARTSVVNEVPASRELGENPAVACSRIIQGIEDYKKKHFEYGGQGSFGDMLKRVQQFQVERFRELIHQWLLNTLNGSSSDPRENLAGKLGYAQAFFGKLVKMLDAYDHYIRDVKDERSKFDPPLKKQMLDAKDYAEQTMQRHKDEKCIFFWVHPRAHITQRSYLWAADDYHTVVKDDMLLEVIDQTTCQLRQVAEQAQGAVEKWMKSLVLGTDSSEGVYRSLETDLKDVSSVLVVDRALTRSQHLINMKSYTSFDQVTKDRLINEQFRRIHWDVSSKNGLGISCQIKVPVKTQDPNGDLRWVDEERTLSLDDSETAKKANLEVIKQIGLFAFREEGEKHQAIDEVMRMVDPNYSDYATFGEDLIAKSGPLIDQKVGIEDSAMARSWYLRVNDAYRGISPEVIQYSNKLKTWINDRCRNFTFQSTQSEDSHQLTFVQVVDVIQSSDFNQWNELREAYREHITSGAYPQENASRLHIFPAERNAAEYETKLFTLLHRGHRIFHPRVVMLMEDKRRIQLFFRCWALHLIQPVENKEKGVYSYALIVPRRAPYIEQRVTLTNPFDKENRKRANRLDILEMINVFVNKGCDVHVPQNQIVWDDLENTVIEMEDEERRNGQLQVRLEKTIQEGIVRQLHNVANSVHENFRINNPQAANRINLLEWGPGQEYDDLADLAEMIYREVMVENEPIIYHVDPFGAPAEPSKNGGSPVSQDEPSSEEPQNQVFGS